MAWWRKREAAPESQVETLDPDGPVIRMEGLSKIFKVDGVRGGGASGGEDVTRALDNITLDIPRGQYVAISGPSGCGKSTFLSLVALLDTPTSGRYWLNGRPADKLSPAERARARNLDVGIVFQSFNLIADMTVYENVEYPLTMRGVPAAERRTRVEAALERVGLAGRAKSRPGSLSGGHQQLVAVARAITGRPSVLLADEPTGNLDSKSGESLMQMFSELHDAGATICIATHDPRWIAKVQRNIYLLDGRIDDSPPN